MKKSGFITFAALSLFLLLGATWASALEPIPQESGFSGFIRPGVGYMRFKSNMVASFMGTDLSDEKTDSLSDSPDSESSAVVMAPFRLAYTFASTRTEVFLGTELADLVRFDFAQQLGAKQEIGRFGILQAGVLFSGVPAKVWRDPYQVNQNRDETSRKSNGGRLVWDRIFGIPMQVRYTYRNIDIGSEKSGQPLPWLTSSERDDLDRDGDRHIGEILYRFRFAKKHLLAPAFIYTNDDLDGEAMSGEAYDFQLSYGYRGTPFTFTANAFIGFQDYDEENPIYRKERDDDRYGAQGALYYQNPWGWKLFGSNPMNFFVSAAAVVIDSNIDFYEQEALIATGGVFFKW
jgi:hypothetical protein